MDDNVKAINVYLRQEGGCYADGKPYFRIVWVNSQTEKVAVEYTRAGLALPYKVVEERKKYRWMPNRNCYALEHYAPENKDKFPDLKDYDGYEMIVPFLDKDDNPIDPDMEAVRYMMKHRYIKKYKRTEASDDAKAEKAYHEEVKKLEEVMSE